MFNSVSGGAINFANVTAFVSMNQRAMVQEMTTFASGRRVMRPADSVSDYFVGNNLKLRARERDEIRRQFLQASSVLDVAEGSVREIFDDLLVVKELVRDYFNTNREDEKKAIALQIDNIKALINQTVENTVFNGKQLLKDSSQEPLVEIRINPHNLDERFTISFGADREINTGNISLDTDRDDAIAAVEEEIKRASGFMGAISASRIGLDSHYNLNEIMGNTAADQSKKILGVDDMDGIMSITKRQIQQQAAVSMLAQGNMMRAGVLNLIKF
jgi:flagellin